MLIELITEQYKIVEHAGHQQNSEALWEQLLLVAAKTECSQQTETTPQIICLSGISGQQILAYHAEWEQDELLEDVVEDTHRHV